MEVRTYTQLSARDYAIVALLFVLLGGDNKNICMYRSGFGKSRRAQQIDLKILETAEERRTLQNSVQLLRPFDCRRRRAEIQ